MLLLLYIIGYAFFAYIYTNGILQTKGFITPIDVAKIWFFTLFWFGWWVIYVDDFPGENFRKTLAAGKSAFLGDWWEKISNYKVIRRK